VLFHRAPPTALQLHRTAVLVDYRPRQQANQG